MKKIISLVLALLLTISSLQVCFAGESQFSYSNGYQQAQTYSTQPSFTIYNNSSSSSSNGNLKFLLVLGLGLLLWFKHKTIFNNFSNFFSNFSTNFTSRMSEENSSQGNFEGGFVNINNLLTLLSSFGTSLKTFFQRLFLGENYNQENFDSTGVRGLLTNGEEPTCSAQSVSRGLHFNFSSITTILRYVPKIVQIPFLVLRSLIPKVIVSIPIS